MDHKALASTPTTFASGSGSSPYPSGGLAKCPIDHGPSETLNPLNQMPTLPQERAVGQTADLPLDRETSSIPRASDSSKWEYPSAQQFYNALVRKGWETPEEHVQTMVDIHNFLNEEAWQEILKWEPLSVILSLLPLSFKLVDLISVCTILGILNRIWPSSKENLANYHPRLGY